MMMKLILSTGNIVSTGSSILSSPGGIRSNPELTNSLRKAITTAKEYFPTDLISPETPLQTLATTFLPSWTHLDNSILFVPRIHWYDASLQEEPGRYDITVKLFFLPLATAAERAAYIEEALALVWKGLGADKISLLIASFPGLSFEGDCEWKADRLNATQGNLDDEVATWKVLEKLKVDGLVDKLGIAEFGSDKLEKFISRVSVRPAVDQISVQDCCKVPPPLVKLAEKEGIELLAHKDSVDVLPSGTLRELLGHSELGAGLLVDSEKENGLKGDLRPLWVAKYTAVVRDRGVIENKGYFAGAELISA